MTLSSTFKAALAAALLAAAGCSPGNSQAAVQPAQSVTAAASAVRAAAVPVTGGQQDYRQLMNAIGDSRFVLLGESTHGTHEFYRERARISEELIRTRGFGAIAIEGDWTPTYRVNLYVQGLGSDRNAAQALSSYTNFPQWMWGNTDFRDLVERLRTYNLSQPPERRVRVYGMDVYDMFGAAEAAVAYARRTVPAAAARVERQYRCFRPYGRDTHAYGEAARRPQRSCQEEAAAALAEVRRIPRPADPVQAEAHFAAVQSATSVAAAEAYFRTVYAGSMAWNVRDQQMARNLDAIAEHLAALRGQPGKVIAWGHNTHSGDARATFAAARGELNLGQLMRQRYGKSGFLIGFLTHSGTVMAAPEWDQSGRLYDVRPALPESYGGLFHSTGLPAFSLVLRGNRAVAEPLRGPMLERAIGVIYQPQTERMSHYFEARLSDQFDAVIYFDKSRAVRPVR
ncbi:MAG: Protein-L-isoaspartate O-methyltransferase [uncultured Sphingosinicella sp.]|uniref:Protein-L-isoaspartate O-methyltransferase n=1 Tax=uncultured Sphingosinicella sp. TaxID=478748 RepID=A0A6J4TIE3_9SPHN|nr:erythromycin esterase family protein [uncultured Sphingosinicella sp.]CAA9523997.1 MAG: Protein-L-isoaspartate O-methyltransferase [uncultured Sphingosinicella sp.]